MINWTPRKLKLALNLYPPYLFAGMLVTHIDPNWRGLDEIKPRPTVEDAFRQQFDIAVFDEGGSQVATVTKTIHVRRKRR